MIFNRVSRRSRIDRDIKSAYPRLWRYAYVLSGNRADADDIAQATVVRALESLDRYRDEGKMVSWLIAIAHRLWLNDLRAQKIRRGAGVHLVEDLEIPDDRIATEKTVLAHEMLRRAMALPEAQRTALVLVYVEGYSYAEAATMMDIPIGTIMSRLAAARARLTQTAAETLHDVV